MTVSEALAKLKVAVRRAGIYYHEDAKARRRVEVFAGRGVAIRICSEKRLARGSRSSRRVTMGGFLTAFLAFGGKSGGVKLRAGRMGIRGQVLRDT